MECYDERSGETVMSRQRDFDHDGDGNGLMGA
jgi:hypothetical protein